MAFDITSLIALVVAFVALTVAALQLIQQLLATGYVIRKCDRIVTGGLTRGGARTYHWAQCRFTVKYEALAFSFSESLYTSLGVNSAIQVEATEAMTSRQDLCQLAREKRGTRTSAQGCWVSFFQDVLDCIPPEHVSTRWESADRIPDDLTIAPIRVDAITVMLLGVASGMSLSKYEPTTGEISMSGQFGAISSSVHPVLGGLIHYSTSARGFIERGESLARHAKAVRQPMGVWANAVFGRFNDRSYGRGYVEFRKLRFKTESMVKRNGWPEQTQGQVKADTVGTACCFMVFGNVDIYETVPPSPVVGWRAHCAEVIVKAHLCQIRNAAAVVTPEPFKRLRSNFIERYGCSSPHLPWDEIHPPTSPIRGSNNPDNREHTVRPDPVRQAAAATTHIVDKSINSQQPLLASGPSTKTTATTAERVNNPSRQQPLTPAGPATRTTITTIDEAESDPGNQLDLTAPGPETQTTTTKTTIGVANKHTAKASLGNQKPLADPRPDTQTATTSTERSNNIPQNPVFLAIPELQPYAALHGDPDSRTNPSSFLPISAAYEAILCADYAMHMIHRRKPEVVTYAEKIVVKSIAKLVDIGPPSWGGAAASIKEWPDIIGDAYRNVMQELAGENSVLNRDMEDLLEYAHLYSLRASYYTVIVGASGEVGPAFTNQAVPVTALAYMV